MKYCCSDMENSVVTKLSDGCSQREIRDENRVIYYLPRFREYGIPVRDNALVSSSVITIQYCPFCGQKLPESKRDELFDTLEALGYDSLFDPNLPEEFLCSAWWEKETHK